MTEERLTKTIDCLKTAKKEMTLLKREDEEDKELFNDIIGAMNVCILRAEAHKDKEIRK